MAARERAPRSYRLRSGDAWLPSLVTALHDQCRTEVVHRRCGYGCSAVKNPKGPPALSSGSVRGCSFWPCSRGSAFVRDDRGCPGRADTLGCFDSLLSASQGVGQPGMKGRAGDGHQLEWPDGRRIVRASAMFHVSFLDWSITLSETAASPVQSSILLGARLPWRPGTKSTLLRHTTETVGGGYPLASFQSNQLAPASERGSLCIAPVIQSKTSAE
jgi:hypothetical protein